MTILIVEDDPTIAEFVARGLAAAGLTVEVAERGDTGLSRARSHAYAAIVLDINLPGMNGRDICRALREDGSRVPIIMLTALDSSQDIVRGLRFGADDYVTKPFVFDEFRARLEALIRRAEGGELRARADVISLGGLAFDRDALVVTAAGTEIELTSTEYALLELLMLQAGRVVSKAKILENVWGISKDPLTNVVEVYVGRLRSKIGDGNGVAIKTVRGRGYRMIEALVQG